MTPEEVLYDYARAMDDRSIDALEPILTDDACLTRFDGTRYGRDAVVDFYRTFWDSSPVRAAQHMVTNVRARPEDGGIRVDAYFQAFNVTLDGATHTILGRYSDSLRDDGSGGWLLAHKRIEMVARIPLPDAAG